jgi:hypothetical protein
MQLPKSNTCTYMVMSHTSDQIVARFKVGDGPRVPVGQHPCNSNIYRHVSKAGDEARTRQVHEGVIAAGARRHACEQACVVAALVVQN